MPQQGSIERDDPNIEVSDVEPDRGAPVLPTDGDVEELRVMAQRDFAARVDLVGADPEVCFGNG
jgi:hypothetical protein